MSWGQLGREQEGEAVPPTSAFRWVAVAALCLAVALFSVAFVTAERRADSESQAPAAGPPASPAPPSASAPVPSDAAAAATKGATPTAADRVLFDFADGGTAGWQYGDWQEGPPGEVAPAPAPAGGVTIVSPAGRGWFGSTFLPPVDLEGARTLSYDVDGPRSDVIVALRVGPRDTWCETRGPATGPGARTVTVDLGRLLEGCDPKQLVTPEDLSDVRSVQIWFSEGAYTLSSVRVSG